MNLNEKAQNGVLSDPTPFVEYLTFNFIENPKKKITVSEALNMMQNIEKSIGQKDTTANLTLTFGISSAAWDRFLPNHPKPEELHDFIELKEEDRHFPSTNGHMFVMIKSERQDLNYQAAKHLRFYFEPIADLIEDIQGYKYLDDRDFIDFVDGTENPKGRERESAVLVSEGPYQGGSYLIIQKYLDRDLKWNALSTEEQEGVVGRTKMDDIEIDDDKKKPYAHNVKTKVYDEKDQEIKMLRQNRPFGNALEHGTMFVGFAASASVIETSLKQMVVKGEDGYYDKLLDFVEAKTGANYFVLPKTFVDELSA